MALIPIVKYQIEEINYFLDYFTNHISEYKLSELTNNYCADTISIISAHPIALEYANMLNADENGNYTSVLPCIGIELMNDGEYGQQYLGSGQKSEEITQQEIDNIEAIALKNRYTSGVVLSKTNLENLKTMKITKGSEKLWSKKSTYLQDIQLNVSIWSDNFVVTRIIYVVIRDMLKRIKHDASKDGAKNMKINGQGALYNFEFNTTLYGAEFQISFLNTHYQIEIDDSLETIKSIEESIVSPNVNSRPTFVVRN
jgi:hypothetical protein